MHTPDPSTLWTRHSKAMPGAAFIGLLLFPTAGRAAGQLSAGDTSWMLVSSALVMFMTPGLALFYGGMARTKNVLSTLMYSLIALGVITLQWVFFGYSLAFSNESLGGFIGNFNYAFLHHVDFSLVGYDGGDRTYPHLVFMLFQMMFAIITPALISGAMVERTRFVGYVLFLFLWSTLIYDPVVHWFWNANGWLSKMGALDYAGGAVIHLTAGVSALMAAIYLGRRKGWPHRPMLPHNLTMTVTGAGILWFGWFGFNAGSALAAGGGAAVAFTNTHVAAASAAVSWAAVELIHRGKASVLGVISGLVAGLATITPAAGFVSPMSAVLIGLIISPVCYGAIQLKGKLGYDDSLDAFGVHGVGGCIGTLLVGVFASAVWGAASGYPTANGLLYGGPRQLLIQLIAVGAAAIYTLVGSLIILKTVDLIVGLRVDEESEERGLDLTQHGESGYEMERS